MDRKMRILISYDGSDHANAVLRNLGRAGLPPEAEAIVISTTDASFPAPAQYNGNGSVRMSLVYPTEAVDKATAMARQASEMIRNDFPDWEIRINLAVGSTVRVIAKKAGGWNPDLIVIGSQKHSGMSNSIFRAFSRQVDPTMDCSIRFARNFPAPTAQTENQTSDDIETRILVCVDESPRAEAIVNSVASRFWPKGTEVRLLTVVNPFNYSIVDLLDEKISRTKSLHRQLINDLDYSPVYASSVIKEGEPVKLILKEAEEWKPDGIFIGTRGISRLHRMLSGSLSAALVARAHCPVELVRTARPMSPFTELLRLPATLLGI